MIRKKNDMKRCMEGPQNQEKPEPKPTCLTQPTVRKSWPTFKWVGIESTHITYLDDLGQSQAAYLNLYLQFAGLIFLYLQ